MEKPNYGKFQIIMILISPAKRLCVSILPYCWYTRTSMNSLILYEYTLASIASSRLCFGNRPRSLSNSQVLRFHTSTVSLQSGSCKHLHSQSGAAERIQSETAMQCAIALRLARVHSLVWGNQHEDSANELALYFGLIDWQNRFCWQNQNQLEFSIVPNMRGQAWSRARNVFPRSMNWRGVWMATTAQKNYLKINLTTS